MKAYYHDQFELPLPPGHRFPIEKYEMLRQRVEQSGLMPPEDLSVSPAAADEVLLRVHSRGYLEKVVHGELTAAEVRRIGFPWSPPLVERARRSVGGTVAAVRSACAEAIAINLAGGTHHAASDYGAGFCVFNDVAVAARAAQAEGVAHKVLVLDCDVHQGDGTASIFAGDDSVFTFSIHGQRNYPFRKIRGDLDIGLPDGCGDDDYLEALNDGLETVFNQCDPGLVLYLAGADPYSGDRFGRLSLSLEGLRQRDLMVLEQCHQRRLPTVIVMAGGYAADISDTVDIHLGTFMVACQVFGQGNPG